MYLLREAVLMEYSRALLLVDEWAVLRLNVER